ncbi:MAG: hypothetical protein E7D87_07820, partial [Streptococcus salivarius]|nr:hypothetical protein [Streptococcus salivarius]
MTKLLASTKCLEKKVHQGMTLRQFLNETGNSHLFIKKDGMVAINTLLVQSGLIPISCEEA